MTTVEIDGVIPDGVLDIQTGSKTGNLGEATLVLADISSNRDFQSGDKVVIARDGGEDWQGYLTGKPVQEGEGELEINAFDTRYELKQRDLSRVFYDMDSGEAIRESVLYTAEGRGRRRVHDGSSTLNWDSDAPIFETAGLQSKQINERGSDLVFLGIREGATGSYHATFDDVPSNAIPGDGQVLRLETRLLVNDPGNQITGEIELRDNAGNQYVWEVEYRGTEFNEYELKAEEADSDGELSSNGTLEYRFDLSGELADNIGIVIDYAATYPFVLLDRDTDLTVNNVQTTGRNITRRADTSVLEFLQTMGTEDGYASWLDTDDDLHFEPSGGSTGEQEVIYQQTPVTSASFDTDYDSVDNKVTVKGNDYVQVTLEDSSSIEFYGVSPRSEPLVDEEIQTLAEAEDRGRGYLEENAWNDTLMQFEIADSSYQAIQKGEAVFVDWTPRSVSGYFIAEEINTDKHGVVNLKLGVRV